MLHTRHQLAHCMRCAPAGPRVPARPHTQWWFSLSRQPARWLRPAVLCRLPVWRRHPRWGTCFVSRRCCLPFLLFHFAVARRVRPPPPLLLRVVPALPPSCCLCPGRVAAPTRPVACRLASTPHSSFCFCARYVSSRSRCAGCPPGRLPRRNARPSCCCCRVAVLGWRAAPCPTFYRLLVRLCMCAV